MAASDEAMERWGTSRHFSWQATDHHIYNTLTLGR